MCIEKQEMKREKKHVSLKTKNEFNVVLIRADSKCFIKDRDVWKNTET